MSAMSAIPCESAPRGPESGGLTPTLGIFALLCFGVGSNMRIFIDDTRGRPPQIPNSFASDFSSMKYCQISRP